jgi:hypothetical protein
MDSVRLGETDAICSRKDGNYDFNSIEIQFKCNVQYSLTGSRLPTRPLSGIVCEGRSHPLDALFYGDGWVIA